MWRDRALGLPEHARATECIEALGRDRWDSLDTFATVRDPLARLVSCWAYGCPAEVARDASPEAFRNWIVLGCRLPQFLHTQLVLGGKRRLWIHEPQVEWLIDRAGELTVKRLVKLEEIDDVWPQLFANTKVEAPTLPKKNVSSHEPVDRYRGEMEMRFVRERYAVDYELLGYER